MGSVFTSFDSTDIVASNPTEVSYGMWTNNSASLTQFYTGTQSSSLSGLYFWSVYNLPYTASSPNHQFDVAYGNRTNGGATSLIANPNSLLTNEATYLQYRNILLPPGQSQFVFQGYATDNIYVVSIARSQLRQDLDPGNWELALSGTLGQVVSLIDDSQETLSNANGIADSYNIVSGSLTGVSGSTIVATGSATNGGFGLVYPSLGIMVFNADAIASTVGFASGSYTVSGSKGVPFGPNTGSLFNEYNHVGFLNSIILGGNFQARSSEVISSTHYNVIITPSMYNYSNNPTYFNPVNGNINIPSFINSPITYPTTIGFYNDNNELLAVAKLNNPVEKLSTSTLVINARIDY